MRQATAVRVFVHMRECVYVCAQAAPRARNTEAFLSVSNMWEQLITVGNHARNLSILSLIILIFDGV